jgi:hypothetical protein
MKDSEDAFLHRMLKEHPEWANWTIDEFRAESCRLQAEIEDREERHAALYREHGCLAVEDSMLFSSIWRRNRQCETIQDFMNYLRAKRHRGHLQQRALDTWNAHYAGRDGTLIPDDKQIEYLEGLFEKREAGHPPMATGENPPGARARSLDCSKKKE